MEDFQIEDLEVVAPTRTWSLLTPGFTTLNIDKAAQTVNQFGQTVIVLNSLDEWDEYGEMELELEETRFSGDLNRAIQEAYIGDTLTIDVAGAIDIGMKTIWVNRTKQTHPVSIKPTITVNDLYDAVSHLEAIEVT